MGPLEDIITGCVLYLIALGVLIGLCIAGLIWALS
jgi:hypothetical protein